MPTSITYLMIGIITGVFICWIFLRYKFDISTTKILSDKDLELSKLRLDLDNHKSSKEVLAGRLQELTHDMEKCHSEIRNLAEERATLQERLNQERQQSQDRLKLMEDNKHQLKLEFESLAHKFLDQSSKKMVDKNKDEMDNILRPLRQHLDQFEKKVSDGFHEGTKQRISLESHIKHLSSLNQQLSADATNLANALKGDSKTRGTWGEVVLERVLEQSGLTKGREYQTQVNLKDEFGSRYLPDVIVHLPEGKDIIIDSKVSLKHWEEYCSEGHNQPSLIAGHVQSIRNHLKDLSEKNYDQLQGVRSLDFVLMFIPIETAFVAAMETAPDLFSEAFKKGIVMVTPSTLLITLRTIENIWRYEDQNLNAQEIANQAGKLYDKFAGFIDSLDGIGKSIEKAEKSYLEARNRLVDGKGNMIRTVQKLREMGVSSKKSLPDDLLQKSQSHLETISS